MANPVGPLLPADEQFTHQVVDTFATVGTTDPSWTEKVCAMAAARDGSAATRLRARQVHQPQRDGRVLGRCRAASSR